MNFYDLYENIVCYDDLDNELKKKVYISDKEITKKMICRFCGKSEGETTFDKASHTIPEMVGNRWLFSEYECRECNKSFGDTCEDSLGKYLLPFKIVSSQFGKKRQLGYSEVTGELRMNKEKPILPEFDDICKMLIKETKGGNIVTFTENGFDLKIKRKKYTPQLVYFSLIKMAISIMPYELLNNYIYIRSLLKDVIDNNDNERDNIFRYDNFKAILEFVPGREGFEKVSVELFKRKKEAPDEYVLLYFCLNFGNYSLQIPLIEDCKWDIGKFKVNNYMHYINSVFNIIDFRNIEEEYVCSFEALKIELTEEEREQLQLIIKGKQLEIETKQKNKQLNK